MERVILHCDMNNFYASVACLSDEGLKLKPLAVGGDEQKRHGIVLAKNELAKKFGVKTGDALWEARQKCPDIVFVKPDFDSYMEYSKRAFEIYTRFTSMVEPFGADECWLDCTGSLLLFKSGENIATLIRETIKKELKLTASVGVSFNKVFAKLGSDLKKPDATTIISKSDFKQKIFHLDVADLFGVGKKTAAKLEKLNIKTIGELANSDISLLKSHFGIVGQRMHENANGLDNEPVREAHISREIKSVGHGMTATKDIKTSTDAHTMISYLTDMIGSRMRRYNVKGRGVALSLRHTDLTWSSKQTTLDRHVFTANEITAAAMDLLNSLWDNKPIRTLTVSVFNLQRAGIEQISIFDKQHEKTERLELALDKIRLKHGKNKIYLASLMESDFIYDKTEGEDFLPFFRG